MKNADAYVGIHFRDINKSNPNTYGNNILRNELGQLGVGTYIIPNSQAYNTEEKTAIVHPVEGDAEMKLLDPVAVELTESGLSVVRARVHTPRQLENEIPVLNGPKLRDIGSSKWAQYEIARDYMPKTVTLEENEAFVQDSIDGLSGDTIVIKADKSQDSQYIDIRSRAEVGDAVDAMRAKFAAKEAETGKDLLNKRILLQEFVAGKSWPGLRAADEQSLHYMQNSESLELRVYCFIDRNQPIDLSRQHYATARSVFKGTDEWVHVEQESVPQEAWAIASDISTKLLEKADVSAGYFAVDLIRGNMPGDETNERIYLREINTRDPMMIEMHENHTDAVNQRRLLAQTMASIARRSL